MKKLIGILLVLSSCVCNPIKFDRDVRRVLSFKFNECRCQWYNLNEAEEETLLEPCEDFFAREYPNQPIKPNLAYCDDLVGFNKNSWAGNISPKARKIIRAYKDECGETSKGQKQECTSREKPVYENAPLTRHRANR